MEKKDYLFMKSELLIIFAPLKHSDIFLKGLVSRYPIQQKHP